MFRGPRRPDEFVIRQVLNGRRERFSELVNRYQPVVYGVALAHTGNHADAEDVVQDTFLKAFQSLGKLRESSRFGSWLVSIAKNVCRDLKKKHTRESFLAENADERIGVSAHDLSRKELHDLLWTHVLKLEEISREILILYYFSGKNTREIASILDISNDASQKRLQRARDVLGRELVKVLGIELRHQPSKELTKKLMAAITVLPAVPGMSPALAAEGVALSAWTRACLSFGRYPLMIGAVTLSVFVIGSLWILNNLQGENEIGADSVRESPTVGIADVVPATPLLGVAGAVLSEDTQSSASVAEETNRPEMLMAAATATPEDAERILNFPEDRSLGMLKIRDANISDNWIEKGGPWPAAFTAGWEDFREATGEVRVPADRSVALHVSKAASEDISPLAKLGPDDLDMISFNNGTYPEGSQVKDTDLVHLRNLTGLRALEFWETSIDGSGLGTLRNLQQLEELDMGACEVTNGNLARMPNLRSLRWLSLHATDVSEEGVVRLARLPSLKHLLLSGSRITNEGLDIFDRFDALEELQIASTKVTDEGMARLAASPTIRSLRIGGDGITSLALEHLAGMDTLRELRVDGVPIDAQGFMALQRMRKLETLHIYATGTDYPGLKHLRNHPSLRRIEMNNLGDEAIEYFSTMPSMEVIYSHMPRITEKSISYLQRMSSLKELMLTGATVGDELLMTLKRALPGRKVWDRNRGADFPVTGWRYAFESVYRLDEGEVLRLIVPPFIPERDDYWKSRRGGAGSPGSVLFKWVQSLQPWSQAFGGGGRPLFQLLNMMGFAKGDFAGNTDILETVVAGDWIFRESAGKAEILESLETILLDQAFLQLAFQRTELMRPTITVSGQYSFSPLPGITEDNEVHLFVDLYDVQPTGQMGKLGAKVADLIESLSHVIDFPVVDEAKNDDIGDLTLSLHPLDELSDPALDPDVRDDLLLQFFQNLADQTSLAFTLEEQAVDVWLVE